MSLAYSKPKFNPQTCKWEIIVTKTTDKTFLDTKEFDGEDAANKFIFEKTLSQSKKLKEEIILTPDQESKIVDFWNSRKENPPSLLEIAKHVFGDYVLDARDKEGRAIKKFLAYKKIKAKKTDTYIPKPPIELTKSQQEFVINNYKNLKDYEIAREVFSDNTLTPFSRETKIITKFKKDNSLESAFDVSDDNVIEDYEPPTGLQQTIERINEYVFNNPYRNKRVADLTDREKKSLQALIGYLHNIRFISQMNAYRTQRERRLLENAFVGYTYDKPDLTAEDVSQYILLAVEDVIISNNEKHQQDLHELFEKEREAEDPRFKTNLIEAMKDAREFYHKSVQRKKELYDQLTVKRSKKLETQIQANQSLVQLVSFFQEENKRRLLVEAADARKQEIISEIDRLKNMDAMKFQIWGVDPNEIVNS